MNDDWKNSLTIGIPVYNEEKYIAQAIESAINQAGKIIISDNASTDKTGQICREFAQKYENIEYIRQENNIGGHKNFKYILDITDTPYLMWLGGHDMISENYSENLIKMLGSCPDALLAYSPSQHIEFEDKTDFIYEYWFNAELSSDDPFKRVYCLIKHLVDCSLFNGVFKTNAIKEAFFQKPSLACDNIALTHLATKGRFLYSPYVRFYRRNVRKEYTIEQKVTALVGDNKQKSDSSYNDLKTEQLKAIKKIKTKNLLKRWHYIKKTQKTLRDRWG